jgi:geranylgeranyl pyrophosphate synthase
MDKDERENSIKIVERIILESKSLINERLRQKYATSILSDEPQYEKTTEAMRYGLFIGGGGKRIRSAMLLTVADAFGGRTENSIRYACAVEEIHSYTLILDDIQDNDDLRRGRAATHIEYGVNTAVLAASRLYERGIEPVHQQSANVMKLGRRLLDDLHRGQAADLESKGIEPYGQTHQLEFIQYGKTSTLFELSVVLGAISSGREIASQELGALSDFAYFFGRAFQTRDDVLSQTATSEQLGKPAGRGADEDKLTAVTVFGSVEAAQQEASSLCEKGIKALQNLRVDSSMLAHTIKYATYRDL